MKHLLVLSAGLLSLTALGCSGDDSGSADTDGTGSSGSDTGGPVSTTPPVTTAVTTMGQDGTSTGDDPSGDSTTATSGPSDSSDGPSDSSDGPSDSSEGGSSGGGSSEYPPCNVGGDPVCEKPYDNCYNFIKGFTVCTQPCGDPSDCPEAGSGDATVVCAGIMQDQCLLDCGNGETCPDGMSCGEVMGGGGQTFSRCVWPIP